MPNEKFFPVLIANNWEDYELLDSGLGNKLERFAQYIVCRPDPRALWQPTNPELWDKADAVYVRKTESSGEWNIKRPAPENWQIHFNELIFTLRPTTFKHIGVFPEQAPNWQWIARNIAGKPINILNLFGYTGGATLAAAHAGAKVTHVDASKPIVSWAKENADMSHINQNSIRWILDDAMKFVQRESRRGATYDGIIMDPPRFGRGTKGEVWKLALDLPKLLSACHALLPNNPTFVLINAYAADISSIVLSYLMEELMKNFGGTIESGELALKQSTTGRLLPSGIFARWSAN